MKEKAEARQKLTCSLCGRHDSTVTSCVAGFVCEACAEESRQGRDSTTRAVKLKQRSMRGQAQKLRVEFKEGVVDEGLDFDIASSEILAEDALQLQSAVTLSDGGEVLPRGNIDLLDTLEVPGTTALDASRNRMELVTSLGTDVAAMALDASDTIHASNSMEKMLAHQMAVMHDAAMRSACKANLEQDPVQAVRMMNLSIRAMETFQKGLLVLKRLRGTGEQRIVIRHVSVEGGSQAVIGNIKTGGGGKK